MPNRSTRRKNAARRCAKNKQRSRQMNRTIRPIGHIHTLFPEKFGLPRQSSLKEELLGALTLDGEYARAEALHGIEGFSHLWLIWDFSEAHTDSWSPTVRPPRLGGNRRVGVFASRSPYRPNSLGLSCVRLLRVCGGGECDEPRCPLFSSGHCTSRALTLLVSGIDMTDGTPIYDIKPYIPISDCRPDASEGYTAQTKLHRLRVCIPSEARAQIPDGYIDGLTAALEDDPRPGYRRADDGRIFRLVYGRLDLPFTVSGDTLTVGTDIRPADTSPANDDKM